MYILTILAEPPNFVGIGSAMTEYQPFPAFLVDFKAQLSQLLHVRSDIDQLSTKRGLPPFLLREILSSNPMSTFIPEQYGGRGGYIRECLALASAAAYES
jgi:hypothetical protein